jgi:hypothetical protein
MMGHLLLSEVGERLKRKLKRNLEKSLSILPIDLI